MKSGGPLPLLVVIGGVEPSGAAGLLRDVSTATTLGARVHAVGTAWTEQAAGVHAVEPREASALADAVRHAVAKRPRAIKIGMVPGIQAAAAILNGLDGADPADRYPGPIVVDPVLMSSAGGALWLGRAGDMLPLLRRATLVTPNAPEAAALTGRTVQSLADAEAAARALREQGIEAVLVKGGHLIGQLDGGDEIADLLVTEAGTRVLGRARVPGTTPRGTGCALATAIATHLARGVGLEWAVETAGAWLAGAIAGAVDVGGERHLRF